MSAVSRLVRLRAGGSLPAAATALLAAAVAVWVRLEGSLGRVFGGDGIRLQGTDAWYHARLAFVVASEPFRALRWDAYAAFPDGQAVPFAGLPDALVAATAWLVALGRPDERTVDAVAAALPVAFGAGAVVLAFLLGARLFGRVAGNLAALLLALSPGPFLERTRPGWADHHGAEACLALLVLYAWARAPTARRPLLAGAAAGLALGAYLLSWSGGAMLVLSLAAWSVGQRLVEQRLGRSSSLGWRTLVIASAVALLAVAALPAWSPRGVVQIAALTGLLATAALHGVRSPIRWLPPRWLVAGLLLASALALVAPGLLPPLAHEVGRIFGTPEVRTVAESQPLFVARGVVGLRPAWEQHGLSLLLLPLSLAWLGRRVWRAADPAQGLLLVWCVTALAATLLQSRFGYYLSGAAAVVDAGLLARGLRAAAEGTLRGRAVALATALAAVATLGSGLWLARRVTRLDRAPSAAWFQALAWLRARTPEPFGDAARYAAPPRAEGDAPWRPPPGAYGVMAWWDYGHWIVKLGRRIPVASPTGVGASRAARFLLAQSEAEAEAEAAGVRYVIVDHELPLQLSAEAGLRIGKLPAVATWAGREAGEFARTVFYRDGAGLRPVLLYEPAYYRTLLARLYLFDGAAVEPRDSSWAVRTERRTGSDGAPWEELVEAEPFPDYTAAQAAAAARPGARVVGLEPARSCVPLEALERYVPVYESPQPGLVSGLPAIRIFERTTGAGGGP